MPPRGAAGRPGRELTFAQKRALLRIVRRHRRWGLPRLRRLLPELPRNAMAAFLREVARRRARRRRRRGAVLVWLMPGAVWAIDGTWFDQVVCECSRRAFVVVELHRRKTLALQSVPGERASAAIAVLEDLITRHGAPLVLKLDNGSAFTARCFAEFCRRHGITLMHSPVRQPSWNGTCEVSGRWAKDRAVCAGRARGAVDLTQDDLDQAVTFTGTMPRIDPAFRAAFQHVVQEQLMLAAAESGLVLGAHLRDHQRRELGRVAVRRALELCHILTIQGREYPQCLPASAA